MGKEEHCKQISLACVGSALSVWATLGLPPLGVCAFPVYTAQAPGCSSGDLSKAGTGLGALPRSKLLRFRFSGTPQGTDSVGSAFGALPRSEQLSRPSAWGAHSPQVGSASYHLPIPVAGFPGCAAGELSQVCHVSPLGSWSPAAALLVDVNSPGSQEMWLATGSLLTVW